MTDEIIKVPLSQQEGAAIMWALAEIGDQPERETEGPTDPLFVLLAAGHSREDIMAACPGMFEVAYGDWLTGPFTPLQRDILRVSVEQSSYIKPFLQNKGGPSPREPRAALRSLAGKLEAFGIEINHIPND